MLRTVLIPVVLLGTTIPGADAAQSRQKVTGFFSDLKLGRASGDLGGVEIFISSAWVNDPHVRALPQTKYYAYVQTAEGTAREPQLVPARLDGNRVAFDLTGSYASMSPFTGAVVGDSLIGSFGNGWNVRLPRRPSYWQ